MTCRCVGDVYRLDARVGSGSFGEVYLGTDLRKGIEVAIKLEPADVRPSRLRNEWNLYKELVDGLGTPRMFWFGTEDQFNCMVYELLGPTLEDLFAFCGRRFRLKTVLVLAEQILNRIEFIHSKGIVHRDLKPDNIAIGLGRKANTIHIIDLGLATTYRDTQTLEHAAYEEGDSCTGTPSFASLSAHRGIAASRRDDLEAIGYVLIYFLRGSLPWVGLRARHAKETWRLVLERKLATPVSMLCHNLPSEFSEYLEYCRALKFEDRPDYSRLRRRFSNLFMREGYSFDFILDWTEQASTNPDGDVVNNSLARCEDGSGQRSPLGSDHAEQPLVASF